MTPKLLIAELEDFSKIHERTPQIVVSHINPAWEDAVRTELADITESTGQAFTIAEADMSMELGRESSRVLEG